MRLQEWVDRLAVLLEGSRDFATSLDPDHLVELLEKQIVRTVAQDFGCVFYSGASRQWTVRRLLPLEPDREALQKLADLVMENRRPLLLEDITSSRLPAPAGPELLSWLCVPMLTEEGATGAILLGAHDAGHFTREHQDLLLLLAFQAAVTLSNAQRFRAVVEARRQLEASQAQLVQSSKMAAVGQLAAGVAHEINSPLGAIMLALDAAESRLGKGSPETVAPKLQRARKAANRARQIIEKLLFYSREPGTEQALLDPVQLAEETLEFLSHQLLMDGVEVHRELTPVPAIRGNSNELQQVVVNLLMNARDALADLSPERRKIKVTTASTAQRVTLAVQDLGPGIPPEVLDRVFEPFYTTKEVGKGTGLGLSISLQIVEQQGGKIEVTTIPGHGTTFTLVFPPG